MIDEQQFFEKLEALKGELKALEVDERQAVIEEVASRLEGFNYAPPVFMEAEQFLRSTKEQLVEELERIAQLPDTDLMAKESGAPESSWELKLQHSSVLVFYFKELASLRNGDLEAWDEVDELYVHD